MDLEFGRVMVRGGGVGEKLLIILLQKPARGK